MYTHTRSKSSTSGPALLCCLHVYAEGDRLDCLDPYVEHLESHALGVRVWVRECYLPMIYLMDLEFVRRRDQDLIL